MNMLALPERQIVLPSTSVPDNAALIRALGFAVADFEAEQALRIAKAQYVLVFNDGDEKLRCERCNGKHMYFTSMCIERPWRGLEHALLGYWTNVGMTNPADLTPAQRSRLEKLRPIFGGGRSTEPLSVSHPRTAHALGTAENDAVSGATILGSLDPITPARAKILAERINSRARRVLVRL